MIRIFNYFNSLSHAAADLFAKQAREAISRRGRFTVALAGGHTPQKTYQLLAQPPHLEQIQWSDVHAFWGDERCVAEDDERNNARMARMALLDRVPVKKDHIHPIRCAIDPKSAVSLYDELLHSSRCASDPALDLVFLGLGQDGHTASLFPHNPALHEKERWVAPVHTAEQELDRVTLTVPLLNAARCVVFLVSGRDKAPILKTVLEGPRGASQPPAQRIRPVSGELIWLVDAEAASLLDGGPLQLDNEFT